MYMYTHTPSSYMAISAFMDGFSLTLLNLVEGALQSLKD